MRETAALFWRGVIRPAHAPWWHLTVPSCKNAHRVRNSVSAGGMSDKLPANQKTCVFCGKPPESKTKEHVIPQWLIERRGDPKRTWNLGVCYAEKDEAKRERRFAANQFHFPACDVCNNAYSDLEGNGAKGSITNLGAADHLKAKEWNDLLDWFDKVRVGLWLGMRLLSSFFSLPPNST